MNRIHTILRRACEALAVYLAPLARPSLLSREGLLAPLVVFIALTGSSCKNFNQYSLDDDVALGIQAYDEVLKDERILKTGPAVDQVNRVTERLVASAMQLSPDVASGFQWETVVIDDPETINAFCLPGGKMAVYTGILAVAEGDAGLAVVMGHEIAHATERHGTERLTRQGMMGSAIDVLATNQDYAQVASVLANLGIGLPWGRSDELEADQVGLMILANAGYDPREAPRFWVRMSAMTGGGDDSAISEFLSTHPSNATRIEELEAAIPAAMPLYQAAGGGNP